MFWKDWGGWETKQLDMEYKYIIDTSTTPAISMGSVLLLFILAAPRENALEGFGPSKIG